MYQDWRYEELSDMPVIVNFMEAGLMRQNLQRRSEILRMADYYQMGQEQWKWDEYDEIWGFEDVPTNFPDYQMHVDAFIDRRERVVPMLIEERDLPYFCARMERRRESRMRRGVAV